LREDRCDSESSGPRRETGQHQIAKTITHSLLPPSREETADSTSRQPCVKSSYTPARPL
jgi:hypothetical protein